MTRSIYGQSGTELPPPVDRTETYIYKSRSGETEGNFRIRMSNTILPVRIAASAAPRRPYSINDSWGWEIIDAASKPIPHDLYKPSSPTWENSGSQQSTVVVNKKGLRVVVAGDQKD